MTTIAFLDTLLHLIILTPFYLIAKRANNKPHEFKIVLYFIGIYLVSNVLTYSLSDITIFTGQRYNWVGKGTALAFLLICVFNIPTFNSRQFGWTTKILWVGTRPILALCFIYFLLRIGLYYSSGSASATFDSETVLFQATLPGLQEELLYRGILLGLLNRIFVNPTWKFCKVEFGWPVIITSILFGMAHGISINNNYHLDINYFNFFRTIFDGFLFALLVQKTKSIFPGVIFHNLLNLIGNH